jgi:hypothetical protein
MLMLLPVVGSATAFYFRKQSSFQAVGLFVLGGAFAAAAFLDVCGGVTSSNWGTYYREQEPVRYWISVGVSAAMYLVLSVAGYFG